MNEKLKFSWAHIIFYIALVLSSYVSYLGLVYMRDGEMIISALILLTLGIVLLVLFQYAQRLKATDHNFHKHVIMERFVIALTPVLFALMVIPFSHFWNIYNQREETEIVFRSSIKASSEIFDKYETYAQNRIDTYSAQNKKSSSISNINRVDGLHLQLLGSQYTQTKTEVTDWINRAQGVTIWNVYMVANIKTIIKCMESWSTILNSYSTHIVANEKEGAPFSTEVKDTITKLNNISAFYTKRTSPSTISYIMMISLYLLLLLPYIVQKRNTKNVYHLFHNERVTYKASKLDVLLERLRNKNSEPESDQDEEPSEIFTL